MKRALFYSLILVVLNLMGDLIIHCCFEPYYEISNIINYFIILIISLFYFCLSLPGVRFLRLFVLPVVFLSGSLLIILLELFGPGHEGPIELLFIVTSLICSIFESINLIIGEVNNDLTRRSLFFIFNSLGVSLILFGVAAFTDYLCKKLKWDIKWFK